MSESPKPAPPPGSAPTSLAALEQAAARDPNDPGLQLELGKHYLSNGQAEQAERAFRRAARLARGSPQPRLGVAASLLVRGMRDEAEAELRKVVEQFPGNADAWFNLGNLHRAALRLDDAARCYRKVLASRGADESACLNLAAVLTLADRFEEAERELRNFIDSRGPTADLLNNLGQALRYQRRFTAAREALLRALEADPGHRGAQLNLAITLRQSGKTHDAERLLRKMIDAEPGCAEARFQLSVVLLLEGRFEEGWKEYRWRDTYRSEIYPAGRLPTLASLRSRQVLVKTEQGLGDVLFFLRFLEPLADAAAGVAVELDPRLRKLLPDLPPPAPAASGTIEVMAGDLPAITQTAQAPAVPLVAAAAVASPLARRLAALGPAPYFAVTWEAGTRLRESNKPGAELYKRIEPGTLAQAFEGVPGTLLSIQRNPSAADLAQFRDALGERPLHDWAEINADLEQALALLSLLDGYVGVSNTNMHLLAGLGRSADVLVPQPPDWRWMQEGESSPWFPGFRVHRQAADLSWDLAVGAVRKALLSRTRK